MAKLFISYSSQDRDRALRLADDLEQAGHEVWIDRKGIGGGTKWAVEITKALESCEQFLLLMSPAALASDNVRKEVDLAAEEKKPFVPIKLHPIEKIPTEFRYHLAGLQHLDLMTDYAQGLRDLLATLPAVEPTISAEEYFLLGRSAVKNGQFAAGLAHLDQAIALAADFALAFYMRGRAYAGLDQHEAAVADFTEAIRLDPQSGATFRHRAQSYEKLGNLEQAQKDRTQAKYLGDTRS